MKLSFLRLVFVFSLIASGIYGSYQGYAQETGRSNSGIIKIQMPSTAEHILMGQATMMQEMMEADIEILKLLKDLAKDQEMRDRIDKLITRYEEMLRKHQTIIEKMMR